MVEASCEVFFHPLSHRVSRILHIDDNLSSDLPMKLVGHIESCDDSAWEGGRHR